MSDQAILILRWLRDCQVKPDDKFYRGYVFGYLNAKKFDLELWEQGYLDAVGNRILRRVSV
jgi:hypothetical protein